MNRQSPARPLGPPDKQWAQRSDSKLLEENESSATLRAVLDIYFDRFLVLKAIQGFGYERSEPCSSNFDAPKRYHFRNISELYPDSQSTPNSHHTGMRFPCHSLTQGPRADSNRYAQITVLQIRLHSRGTNPRECGAFGRPIWRGIPFHFNDYLPELRWICLCVAGTCRVNRRRRRKWKHVKQVDELRTSLTAMVLMTSLKSSLVYMCRS
ncbi:hypothetical protein R3P38DRAFT_154909 [Favolaschia claudopus]|uniref:Maturase K n=1 Tax=Favolaschia claudopus TaxID=2862362 RepID=A0AAV9ZU81_9AGAR